MRRTIAVLGLFLGFTASVAAAADVAIVPSKLIVVDTTASGGVAKVILVAKDAAIAKGSGTDPAAISATVRIAYDAADGEFLMPQGAAWLKNREGAAKYLNAAAPGSASVKVGLIKVGKLLKMKTVSLGETPLDVSSAPMGVVFVADTILNGVETTRLCGQFSACKHKVIAGGTGYKLICKTGAPDPDCSAIPSTTTTTTTTTTICTVGTPASCETGQLGVCSAGTKVCNGAGYTACAPNIPPSAEVCDSRDNNCDGVTDEGCICVPFSSEGCDTGQLGVCAQGQRMCDAAGSGYGGCTAIFSPSDEVCGDGLDNDCDGVVDNGC